MKNVSELIFRQITPADFFNINKQRGAEERGGGQSYIDISTTNVDLPTWNTFFSGYTPEDTQSGPLWSVRIDSLGGLGSQTVKIGQRREASVNIRSQKIFSNASNRIFAWHPDAGGFPRAPTDMSSSEDPRVIERAAGVRIFIAKTDQGEHWAGWLKTDDIEKISAVDTRFEVMLKEPAGHIGFEPVVELDTSNLQDPFGLHAPYNAKAGWSEEVIAAELFQDDATSDEVKKTQKVIEVFERNRKAVKGLKKLYKTCQITGEKYVFPKVNGEPYLEVHHLIPLGEGGADSPENLVVISAHIHRMLYYATVEGLDLSKINDEKLGFLINGKKYTITWNSEHAKVVAAANKTIAS